MRPPAGPGHAPDQRRHLGQLRARVRPFRAAAQLPGRPRHHAGRDGRDQQDADWVPGDGERVGRTGRAGGEPVHRVRGGGPVLPASLHRQRLAGPAHGPLQQPALCLAQLQRPGHLHLRVVRHPDSPGLRDRPGQVPAVPPALPGPGRVVPGLRRNLHRARLRQHPEGVQRVEPGPGRRSAGPARALLRPARLHDARRLPAGDGLRQRPVRRTLPARAGIPWLHGLRILLPVHVHPVRDPLRLVLPVHRHVRHADPARPARAAELPGLCHARAALPRQLPGPVHGGGHAPDLPPACARGVSVTGHRGLRLGASGRRPEDPRERQGQPDQSHVLGRGRPELPSVLQEHRVARGPARQSVRRPGLRPRAARRHLELARHAVVQPPLAREAAGSTRADGHQPGFVDRGADRLRPGQPGAAGRRRRVDPRRGSRRCHAVGAEGRVAAGRHLADHRGTPVPEPAAASVRRDGAPPPPQPGPEDVDQGRDDRDGRDGAANVRVSAVVRPRVCEAPRVRDHRLWDAPEQDRGHARRPAAHLREGGLLERPGLLPAQRPLQLQVRGQRDHKQRGLHRGEPGVRGSHHGADLHCLAHRVPRGHPGRSAHHGARPLSVVRCAPVGLRGRRPLARPGLRAQHPAGPPARRHVRDLRERGAGGPVHHLQPPALPAPQTAREPPLQARRRGVHPAARAARVARGPQRAGPGLHALLRQHQPLPPQAVHGWPLRRRDRVQGRPRPARLPEGGGVEPALPLAQPVAAGQLQPVRGLRRRLHQPGAGLAGVHLHLLSAEQFQLQGVLRARPEHLQGQAPPPGPAGGGSQDRRHGPLQRVQPVLPQGGGGRRRVHARPGPARGLRRPAGRVAARNVRQHARRHEIRVQREVLRGPPPVRQQRVVHPGGLRGGHVHRHQPAVGGRRRPVRLPAGERERHRGPQDRSGRVARQRVRPDQRHVHRAPGPGGRRHDAPARRLCHGRARPRVGADPAGHHGRGGQRREAPVRGQAPGQGPVAQLPPPAVDVLLWRLPRLLPRPPRGQARTAHVPPRPRGRPGAPDDAPEPCRPVPGQVPLLQRVLRLPRCAGHPPGAVPDAHPERAPLLPRRHDAQPPRRAGGGHQRRLQPDQQREGDPPVPDAVRLAAGGRHAARPDDGDGRVERRLEPVPPRVPRPRPVPPLPVQVPGRAQPERQRQKHRAGRRVQDTAPRLAAGPALPAPVLAMRGGHRLRRVGPPGVQHDDRHIRTAPQVQAVSARGAGTQGVAQGPVLPVRETPRVPVRARPAHPRGEQLRPPAPDEPRAPARGGPAQGPVPPELHAPVPPMERDVVAEGGVHAQLSARAPPALPDQPDPARRQERESPSGGPGAVDEQALGVLPDGPRPPDRRGLPGHDDARRLGAQQDDAVPAHGAELQHARPERDGRWGSHGPHHLLPHRQHDRPGVPGHRQGARARHAGQLHRPRRPRVHAQPLRLPPRELRAQQQRVGARLGQGVLQPDRRRRLPAQHQHRRRAGAVRARIPALVPRQRGQHLRRRAPGGARRGRGRGAADDHRHRHGLPNPAAAVHERSRRHARPDRQELGLHPVQGQGDAQHGGRPPGRHPAQLGRGGGAHRGLPAQGLRGPERGRGLAPQRLVQLHPAVHDAIPGRYPEAPRHHRGGVRHPAGLHGRGLPGDPARRLRRQVRDGRQFPEHALRVLLAARQAQEEQGRRERRAGRRRQRPRLRQPEAGQPQRRPEKPRLPGVWSGWQAVPRHRQGRRLRGRGAPRPRPHTGHHFPGRGGAAAQALPGKLHAL